jgi:adenylate kinase
MFRAAVKAGTPMGREADRYMKSGQLVPSEVVIGMVRERLAEPDAAKGFLLDGFPRTLSQAEALGGILEDAGTALDAVVLLEVADALIVERITGRRSDPETGAIYHLKFNPPPAEAAGRLVHRNDDTEDACRERLSAYHEATAPVVPYYDGLGVVCRVDGVGSPDVVTQRIGTALQRGVAAGLMA